MHDEGKIVAVWVDRTAPYSEDLDFYIKCLDLGVDMITTDYPDIARDTLQKYQ
jgi:glycerophosphoryl diester phosphodiesterase